MDTNETAITGYSQLQVKNSGETPSTSLYLSRGNAREKVASSTAFTLFKKGWEELPLSNQAIV